jgi:hypothetical protein
MTAPPRLTVGYCDDGVVLYRVTPEGQPLVLALMDPIVARRYALDLVQVSEHLVRAATEFEAHRALIADVDDAPPPTLGARAPRLPDAGRKTLMIPANLVEQLPTALAPVGRARPDRRRHAGGRARPWRARRWPC